MIENFKVKRRLSLTERAVRHLATAQADVRAPGLWPEHPVLTAALGKCRYFISFLCVFQTEPSSSWDSQGLRHFVRLCHSTKL